MPISVTDLKPGDRVMLNCPKARGNTKREARFDGIFRSLDEAMKNHADLTFVKPETLEFLAGSEKGFARFLMQTVTGPGRVAEYPGGGTIADLPDIGGTYEVIVAYRIEEDGGLREEYGRRVFIERRMTMGQG